MSNQKPIVVKNDEASVIYAFRGPLNDDGTPVMVVPGVASRDLTEFDLAAMDPDQRLRVHLIAKQPDGAYKKVGRLPAGLVMAAGDDDSDEAPPVIEEAPAAPKSSGKEK